MVPSLQKMSFIQSHRPIACLVASLFFAILAGNTLADEPLRWSNPIHVRWDAPRSAFVVLAAGSHQQFTVSTDGKLTDHQPWPASATATTVAWLNAAAGRAAWIDPWRKTVWIRTGETTASVVLPARPQALAFAPDGQTLVIGCDQVAEAVCAVCLVDLTTAKVREVLRLPDCSQIRGVAVDPRGQFVLVTQLAPKFRLPATQIDQGWVFTNAVACLPLQPGAPGFSMPLDLRTQSFANPEGIALSPDGQAAYVAHGGADIVSVIDVPALFRTAKEHAAKAADDYAHDVRLTRRYVRTRIPVGNNPRGVALSADGRTLAVTNRLADSLSLIDTQSNQVTSTVSLEAGPTRMPDAVRLGERLFYSGQISFGGQFSCASCHPDGHTDGLNWDLPADGFNNFENTKTLLDVAGTAPYGWRGTSDSLQERFSGTLQHLFQHQPTVEESASLTAYLTHLHAPTDLPLNVDRSFPRTQRGQALFAGKARCSACHSGQRFADGLTHDILEDGDFDTPALKHVAETAPYLHDGRAPTLESIFQQHNPQGRHGAAAKLSAEELADLLEYVRGL